jgi:hypothetical protein
MVVHFHDKVGNLYSCLRTRSHTIYGKKVGCSIFHSAKFEQMTTPQQVLLQWEIIIDGTAVTIVLVCTF